MDNTPNKSGLLDIKDGQIYYQTYGSGKPIIVLHGGPGGDMYPFLPYMQELANDYEITFYDQRGCGGSVNTQFNNERINLTQYVEDLDDVIKSLGYEKVFIIAHSWGAKLAIEYINTHKDRVEKIIFVAAVPMSNRGQKTFLDDFIIPRIEMFKMFSDKEFIKNSTDKELEAEFRKVYAEYLWDKTNAQKLTLKVNVEGSLRTAQVSELMSLDPILNNGDFIEKAKNIRTPSLVIHGDSDPIPIWTARELKEVLPNSRMLEIANCGHAPFAEASTKFFGEVRRFLSYS